MLEILPGKLFKTRRGQKVRIYDRSGLKNENSCFYWHGAIFDTTSAGDGYWAYCSWDKFGKSSYVGGESAKKPEDGDDIVDSWE